LGSQVGFLGLKSLQSQVGLNGNYRLGTDQNGKLSARVGLDGVTSSPQEGSLPGRISQSVLASMGNKVSGKVDLGLSAAGDFSFAVTSNLDGALAKGLQSAANAELQKLRAQVDAELNSQLTKVLEEEKSSELKKLMADNAGDIKDLGDLQKKVDKQTAELEKWSKVGAPVKLPKLPGF
jgi:hypothetical protein